MRVSLSSGDPRETVRHEGIHALKQAGLFSRKEWNTLLRVAQSEDWIGKHSVRERYSELFKKGKPTEAAYEEAIADEFAEWAFARSNPPTGIKRLFPNTPNLSLIHI